MCKRETNFLIESIDGLICVTCYFKLKNMLLYDTMYYKQLKEQLDENNSTRFIDDFNDND